MLRYIGTVSSLQKNSMHTVGQTHYGKEFCLSVSIRLTLYTTRTLDVSGAGSQQQARFHKTKIREKAHVSAD